MFTRDIWQVFIRDVYIRTYISFQERSSSIVTSVISLSLSAVIVYSGFKVSGSIFLTLRVRINFRIEDLSCLPRRDSLVVQLSSRT